MGGYNYRASLGLRYAQHDLFSTKLVFIVACLYTNCEYFLCWELRNSLLYHYRNRSVEMISFTFATVSMLYIIIINICYRVGEFCNLEN